MPQNSVAVCAVASHAAGDQAWFVGEGSAGVGEFNVGAICDGLEEAEERDFMRSETGFGAGG